VTNRIIRKVLALFFEQCKKEFAFEASCFGRVMGLGMKSKRRRDLGERLMRIQGWQARIISLLIIFPPFQFVRCLPHETFKLHMEKTEKEFRIPTKGNTLNEVVLKLWWPWCRMNCVSGTVVDNEGCAFSFGPSVDNVFSIYK